MITDFDSWLRQLVASQARASGAIFSWCVSSASADVEPRVRMAQFGDGYVQRRPAGINTQDQAWNVELRNLLQPKADAVLDFLSARNGVDVFNWTPPRTDLALDVICPSWSWSYGEMLLSGARTMNVNARFQQVHV
ncbi:phage tail protein [Paraburkholderia silvatlantica]|uniref:phage tail protein n=1 Tax=Paraburkholderia silvatlantica TaxID=321895 RepID=UPI0037535888